MMSERVGFNQGQQDVPWYDRRFLCGMVTRNQVTRAMSVRSRRMRSFANRLGAASFSGFGGGGGQTVSRDRCKSVGGRTPVGFEHPTGGCRHSVPGWGSPCVRTVRPGCRRYCSTRLVEETIWGCPVFDRRARLPVLVVSLVRCEPSWVGRQLDLVADSER